MRIRFESWRYCHSPHLQRAVRVQLTCTHDGYRGRAYGSADTWVSRVYYERDPLMEAWRRAVVALLRTALRAGQLCTNMDVAQMEELLTLQENRCGRPDGCRTKDWPHVHNSRHPIVACNMTYICCFILLLISLGVGSSM